ncbi:MAG: magnesium transporter [archaeon GBS-70-058]|nr:magnesium transporter [Candidatus Culexarchaeum nevadense]
MGYGATYKLNQRILWKSFLQCTFALSFSSGGLLSGRVVSELSPLMALHHWIVALYPVVLTVRGDVAGVFTGNLTTMLNVGKVKASWRGNNVDFYSLIRVSILLAYIDASLVGLLAFFVNLIFGQVSVESMSQFMSSSLFTCVLATLISLPLNCYVAFLSFNRGLDPDVIAYPVVGILNDFLVSLCFSVSVSMILSGQILLVFIVALFLIVIPLFILITWYYRVDRFVKIYSTVVKEAVPVGFVCSFDGVINGLLLASFIENIVHHSEILMIYPVLLNAIGGVGSSFGSVATTKLALGYLDSKISSVRVMFNEFFGMLFSGIFMGLVYSVLGYGLAYLTGLTPMLLNMIILCILVMFIGSMVIMIGSYVIGINAYNMGWDPDNFVIPLETSIADLFGAMLVIFVSLVVYP